MFPEMSGARGRMALDVLYSSSSLDLFPKLRGSRASAFYLKWQTGSSLSYLRFFAFRNPFSVHKTLMFDQ